MLNCQLCIVNSLLVDGQTTVRTNQPAACTTDAVIGVFHVHIMVSLVVYFTRVQFENIRRAGYYAEVTSFASLCVYNNSSFYLRHNLLYLKTNVTLTISFATAKGSKNFTERAFFRNCFDYFTSNDIVFRLPWSSISVRRCLPGEAEKLIWWWSVVSPAYVSSRCQ